ncbi:MAG: hypothetical protein Q8N17_14620 [Burkholderiaceae bacterium]|nr:hypothetical protein [Burkholderiaceae bacterium]
MGPNNLRGNVLQEKNKELRGKLDALEREAAHLRLNLSKMSSQHNDAKAALREMVELSLAAATQAALAADNAVLATKKAVATAKQVAAQNAIVPASVAVQAAAAAAAAAIDSATAAKKAVIAATNAAAHEIDKTAYSALMQNVAKAEADAKRVFASALEAVKLAFSAAEHLVTTGK